MSIRRYQGYWTVFVQEQPVIQCVDFASAWAKIWEICNH
jgi:hypothetical protein